MHELWQQLASADLHSRNQLLKEDKILRKSTGLLLTFACWHSTTVYSCSNGLILLFLNVCSFFRAQYEAQP